MSDDSHQELGRQNMGLYQRLDQNNSTIRLLQLSPNMGLSEMIRGHLFSVSMDEAELLHYIAVSYVWGECDNDVAISLNGHSLGVDKNLSRLLASSCSTNSSASPYFWIDRICIDQSNAAERAEQIRKMKEIYSRAAQVAIFLEFTPACEDRSWIDVSMKSVSGSIHQTVDRSDLESGWKLLAQTPHVHWQRKTTPNLEEHNPHREEVRYVSDVESKAGDELSNASCQSDPSSDFNFTEQTWKRVQQDFFSEAAGTLFQEYSRLHDKETTSKTSSKVGFSVTPLALAANIGNVRAFQFLLLQGVDTVDHGPCQYGYDKTCRNNLQRNRLNDSPKSSTHQIREKEPVDKALVGLNCAQKYRRHSNTSLWIQSKVKVHNHRCVGGLVQMLGSVGEDNNTILDEALMQGMTTLEATSISSSHKIAEMLLRSGLRVANAPQSRIITRGVVEFEIAAQILTRWMAHFPSANGDHFNMAFPSHAFEDWETLRMTMDITERSDRSGQSEFKSCVADGFGWWQLQVRSAFLLYESGKEADICTNRLSRDSSGTTESSKATSQWPRLNSTIFPSDNLGRHFALRSACCVCSSFRPLTAQELFSLSTVKVLQDDPEWQGHNMDRVNGVEKLMSLCERFLCIDPQGFVQFKDREVETLLSRQIVGFIRDAHHFMAVVCLKQIELMGSRILLQPWHDFQRLQERFSFHNYVVTFWQYHYRIAENYTEQLPGQLQILLNQAYIGAKQPNLCTPQMIGNGIDSKDSVLARTSRAVNVGFEFCREYNLRKLRKIYKRMGARTYNWSCYLCETSSDCTKQRSPAVEPGEMLLYKSDDWHMVNPTDFGGI